MAETTILVLDTSVVVKWFSDEELTEKALEIRERYIENEIDLVVPDLLLYELSNALRYNPEFTSEDVRDAMESILDMDFEIVTPTQSLLQSSTETAFQYDLTFYDSIYLALAEMLDAELVTADEEIAGKENGRHLSGL